MELAGTTALITGANRGIGRAITDAMLAAGVGRVYAACRDAQAGQALAEELGAAVVPVTVDVTDPDQVAAAAAGCGDVSILVNNAGVNFNQPIVGPSDADVDRVARTEIEVNYLGLMAMSRAFAPVLATNGGGAIVNILSILARINLPFIGSYCASKAAAFSATQALRAQLAPQGTKVFAIMPGAVDTRINDGMDMDKMAPTEVADAIIAALAADTYDVYPGDQAQGLAAGLAADPAAVEAQMAQMIP